MSQPSVTLCVQNINYSVVKKDGALPLALVAHARLLVASLPR